MKKIMLLLVSFLCFKANAQPGHKRPNESRFNGSEKYFTFNPLALAEPHMAIGAGFGNRFSERSEYFAELSYVVKHPFYEYSAEKSLHGIRFITQYRYHFLQQRIPVTKWGKKNRERKVRQNPFIGMEFRVKPFKFTDTRTFIKSSPADTLNSFLYEANAITIGGALLFGSTHNLSSNGQWKIEVTAGIGGKVKMVKYKNLPAGYQPLVIKGGFNLNPPVGDKAVGIPYFPFAIRLRYTID